MRLFRLVPHSIWKDRRVRERLGWYYGVMLELKPAKFLICKSIPTEIDIPNTSIQGLWKEHDRLSIVFKKKLTQIKQGELNEKLNHFSDNNYLKIKSEIANRALSSCNFCEWNCNVDRNSGKVGVCKIDKTTRAGSWFRHFGEEPPLVNSNGSGTIFFTGCMFHCVFCQNWDISQFPQAGREMDGKKLAAIMKALYEEGASNINLVGGEPTPNIHTIIDALNCLDVNIPILWNSDMYGTVDAMRLLVDILDIWLPDFKYGNNNCARKLSNVSRYFEVVARNHIIASQNDDIIIRHLVMPNHLECCTKPVLKWISENCKNALVNIMGQYHPDYKVARYPDKYAEIARPLREEELESSLDYATKLGLLYEPVS